ncbi:MAG: cytochrome c [Betaproteobacteria bacterium]|nr:cytochrome c [Betaproteobacteria bacterium]
MRASRNTKIVLAVALIAGLFSTPGFAKDPTDEVAAKIDEKFGGNIKKLFATKCSWCHQAYGMKQADGPKLAGTDKTLEQVMKQIKNGKLPMPGFKSQLKEEEVQALAEYIKALPAN